MPILTLEINEQYKSIVRPTVLSVVNELLPFMRMNENVEIIYKGDSEVVLMQNGQIGVNHRHPSKPIRTASTERLTINVDFDESENSILEMPVLYPEQRYIFLDDKLKIKVKPVRKRNKVTIKFGYRFRSKTAADQWKSHMDMLLAQRVQDFVHNVTYHYAYPDRAISLLHKLWGFREANAGYGDTFNEYLLNNSISTLTAVTNQAGKNVDIGIAETLTNCQGWWDFDITPDAEKVNSLGNYQTNFNYVFEYDKVIGLVFYYPVTIHQQPLPESFIPKRKNPTYKAHTYQKPLQAARFEEINKDFSRDTGAMSVAYPRYPTYDEWVPEFALTDQVVQYHALLSLINEDLSDLVDLHELGDYEFDDIALQYIERMGVRIFNNASSIIQVKIYDGTIMLDPELLTIDEDLKVRSTIPLNPRHDYRVVVCIDSNLRGLNELTVQELLSDGSFTIEILKTIYPQKSEYYPEVDEDNKIAPMDWSNFVGGLYASRKWMKRPLTGQLTIGSYTIISRKRK